MQLSWSCGFYLHIKIHFSGEVSVHVGAIWYNISCEIFWSYAYAVREMWTQCVYSGIVVVEEHIYMLCFLLYMYIIGIERANCGGNEIVCWLDEGKVFYLFSVLVNVVERHYFRCAVAIVFVQYKTTNLTNMRTVIVQLIIARAEHYILFILKRNICMKKITKTTQYWCSIRFFDRNKISHPSSAQ